VRTDPPAAADWLGQAASAHRYPTASAVQHVPRSPAETDGVDPCRNFHEYAREKRLSTAVFTDLVSPPLSGPTRVTLLTRLDRARTAAPTSPEPALRALFFVAFANVPRSTSVTAESFRINELVADMPEFARAFGCKAGDPRALPPAQQVAIYRHVLQSHG
jgi:hypothetical protein